MLYSLQKDTAVNCDTKVKEIRSWQFLTKETVTMTCGSYLYGSGYPHTAPTPTAGAALLFFAPGLAWSRRSSRSTGPAATVAAAGWRARERGAARLLVATIYLKREGR